MIEDCESSSTLVGGIWVYCVRLLIYIMLCNNVIFNMYIRCIWGLGLTSCMQTRSDVTDQLNVTNEFLFT